MPERPERFERRDRNGRKIRRKVCYFCTDRNPFDIDYKEYIKLKRFTSERAKILPRRVTGTCAKHQRRVVVAIKHARHLALLPYINN